MPRLFGPEPVQQRQPLPSVLQRPLQGHGFGRLGERRVQTVGEHAPRPAVWRSTLAMSRDTLVPRVHQACVASLN